MPYIKDTDREKFEKSLQDMPYIENKGELEYVVFYLMKHYMFARAARYSTLHDVVYAVQHCADEFRRRFLDKREDDAREVNGDV